MKTKITGIMALMAVACMAVMLPASANLVSTTFGFPVIVQNGSTCAFNQDYASATDYENIAIDFPVFGDGYTLGSTVGQVAADGVNIGAGGSSNVLPFGPVNLAFPSISQTVDQTQTVTHCDFAQTNEFAEFSYPFVGVGDVSLPGFGFGF
jgi:hypothetical protein